MPTQNLQSTAHKRFIQHIHFPSQQDAYPLHGLLYSPQTTLPKANVVIASATGVPQEFYRRFAEYLTFSGYQVLSFDYRGIGRSSPEHLNGFNMDYLDWGRSDLAGAIDYLSQQDLPLFMIGHSYGGQALGMLSNHDQISACYSFGTGLSWSGYMPLKARLKMQILQNLVFPPIAKRYGFMPWSKFNMGTDLPLNVYLQWAEWSKNKEYFFADPLLKELLTQFAQVRTPIIAATSIDDEWASPKSRNAFMKYYPQATIQYHDLIPRQLGMTKIWHMGYFKKDAKQIWDHVIENFDEILQKKMA